MENIKITLPQIPSLKIVLPGQGGTPITVDSEMSDTSKNPVQNKIVNKYVDDGLLPKIELWQPNTEYKVGSVVITNQFDGIGDGKNLVPSIIKCGVTHKSEGAYPTGQYWYDLCEIKAEYTKRDSEGNIIVNTYATKEELGNIDKALDELHNYAQALISGGVV